MRRLALIALAALLAGCGGDDDAERRREALADYIRDANRLQQRSATAYAEADQALRAFALSGKAAARSEQQLGEAVVTLTEARRDLAKLRPPPDAAKLHFDSVKLLDEQVGLARALQGLAGFLPEAGAIIAAAEDGRKTLQRSLGAADTGAEQADAARAYARSAGRTADDFAALEPPAILRTWHAGQLELLRRSESLAGRLATALDDGDEAAIDRVLADFEEIGREATATARAQVVAVRAFNRRVERQRELVRAITREQSRLDVAVR